VIKENIGRLVFGWFDEVVNPGYRPEYIDPYVVDDRETGHYTQLIWATVTEVGCGATLYKDPSNNGAYNYILVCNYLPQGNIQGGSVYKKGPACSGCPKGRDTCENGLCV